MIEYTVRVYNDYRVWRLNDIIQREDGPAIECADGSKYWYKNGQRHRKDGPAVENADGSKMWYSNGVLHRTDGPAIENADGSKPVWFLHGIKYSEAGFKSMFTPKSCVENKIVEIDGKKYRLVEAN